VLTPATFARFRHAGTLSGARYRVVSSRALQNIEHQQAYESTLEAAPLKYNAPATKIRDPA
jgi:hypothetical protein